VAVSTRPHCRQPEVSPCDLTAPPEAYTLTRGLAELDLNVTGAVAQTTMAAGSQAQPGWRRDEMAYIQCHGQEGDSHPAPLSVDGVNFTGVISLEDLLHAQEEMLSPAMGRAGADRVDITPAEGVYSINVHSDARSTETISFRGDTGEVTV